MNDTLKTNAVRPAIACHTELDDNPSASGQASEQEIEYRTLMRKFWFAAIISIPVMFFSYPDFIPGLRDWMPMATPYFSAGVISY